MTKKIAKEIEDSEVIKKSEEIEKEEEKETEEEKEKRILADKALWKPAPAPFEWTESKTTESIQVCEEENISKETQEEKEKRRLEDEALWKPAPPPFELSEEEIIKWRKKYYSEEGMREEKEKKEKERKEKDERDKKEKEKEEKKYIDGEKMFVEEKRNVAEESKFVQENIKISEGIHASLPVAAVMAATNDEVFNGRVPVVEEICVQTRIAPKTSTESPAIKQKTPNSNSKQKKFSKDDLKSLRSNFANKQGVQEVVEPIYDDLVLPKNVQLKNGDNINKSSIQENDTQLMETKNLIKGEENGDQIVNNKMNTEIRKEQETEHLAEKSSGLIDITRF